MQGLQGLHILLDGNLPWRQHMSPVRGLRQLGARAAWSHCPCFVLSLVLLVRSCQHILWLECMPCVTWHWKKWKTHLNIFRVKRDKISIRFGMEGDLMAIPHNISCQVWIVVIARGCGKMFVNKWVLCPLSFLHDGSARFTGSKKANSFGFSSTFFSYYYLLDALVGSCCFAMPL